MHDRSVYSERVELFLMPSLGPYPGLENTKKKLS